MNLQIISYSTVLVTFKIEHETCLSFKDEAKLKVPKFDDRDEDRKIIRLSPMLKDCVVSTFTRGVCF